MTLIINIHIMAEVTLIINITITGQRILIKNITIMAAITLIIKGILWEIYAQKSSYIWKGSLVQFAEIAKIMKNTSKRRSKEVAPGVKRGGN